MGQSIQVGTNLLSSKGGIYQACKDYYAALGGQILSITDPSEDLSMKDEQIDYLFMRGDPLSRLSGYLTSVNRQRLYDNLKQQQSSVFIHGCFRLTAHYCLTAKREYQVPMVFIPHGGLDPWVFTYRRTMKMLWMRLYGYRVLKTANAVLAMTRNEMLKIQRFVGELPNQHVIYLPLDSSKCQQTQDRATMRAQYGIPEGARVLCFLGRLHHMKRPLETIQSVLSTSEKLHLVIAGPDDSVTAEALTQYADKHGARDRIHVTGPLYGDDKYNLLAACDAYISLSHRENFNYTAAEAMAMGLPVILSPGNDLQGEILNNNCGWMLNSLETSAVRNVLEQFSSVQELELRRKGANGRMWVHENLPFERFQQQLNQLVTQISS